MTSRLQAPFRKILKTAVLIAPLFALSACAVNPATGDESFTAFMSPQEEIKIGREEHPKIIEQFGGAYEDAAFNAYVREVGLKLARMSHMPDLNFTITVLNDSKVNAFALPGGFVYVTRGLLALAENEAEMAGVLAHEIGHVTARHTAERYSQAMAANIGLTILDVLMAGSQYGGGVGQIVGLGAQLYLQGYSREQELEADKLAVEYMSRAGYDPQAMSSFFTKMQAHSRLQAVMEGRNPNEAERFSFFSTHPRTADRIVQARRLARATALSNPTLARAPFLKRLDGLLFGDDREQGVRRGRTFSHPELRFTFQVPADFTMFNMPDKVVARGRRGSVIIFDMVSGRDSQNVQGLRGFLVSQWAAGLNLQGVERIVVNGMEAYTGAARMNTDDGVRDVRLVAIGGADGRIFRFVFLTPPRMTAALATALKRTTYSFRRLSAGEAQAIRSLVLKVVAVAPGDTVQSLAASQPVGRFALEWFEVLNGIERNQSLPAGRLVKVISE